MYKIKRLDNIIISYEHVCKAILLIFVCVLYAFYDQRIIPEIFYFATFFLYFVLKRKKLSIYSLWSFLFVGICAMSILWTYDVESSALTARKLLEICIIGSLLIGFIDNREKINFLYKTFVAGGVLLILRLITSFPISAWGTERIGAEILNANRIGLFLTVSSICAMQLA